MTTLDLTDHLAAMEAADTAEDVQAVLLTLREDLEEHPEPWLRYLFPEYVVYDFAPHHLEFWSHVWAIRPDEHARPHVDVWGRGEAKSTNLELAFVALGARARRTYGLYVCDTQDQADDHVANIGSMLESDRIGEMYPGLGERLVGKYGNSRGWRRNRLRTSSGFTVDAIGLDTAARGVKLEADRPDLLGFDDIDDATDSPATTERKITQLTRTFLPAQAEHAAVICVQNLVLPQGVFAKLANVAEEPADFLVKRIISGPVPTVANLTLGKRPDGSALIIGGEPTWPARGLTRAQELLDEIGETAFLIECQHAVTLRGGGMFDHLDYQRCPPEDVPDLLMTTVWVDPAVTDTDRSDSMAIQVDGLASDQTIYRLRSWEQRSSPETAIQLAISWAFEHGASTVGVETDQGGDTWGSVFREAMRAVIAEHPEWADRPRPHFASEKAGAGHGSKVERASRMLADYETPGRKIVHVLGSHTILEAALNRFPRTKPFDLTDASFWSWHHLRQFSVPSGTSASVGAGMPPLRRR